MSRATLPRVKIPATAGSIRRPLATVPDIAEHYGVPLKTVRYWHQTQTGPGRLMFRVGKYLRAAGTTSTSTTPTRPEVSARHEPGKQRDPACPTCQVS